MDPILIGIAVQLPIVAAFLVALEREWMLTGKHHRAVLGEIREGHRLENVAKDAVLAAREATIHALTAELAAVRNARNERERAMEIDADERVAYVEARRQEERDRARDAERLVAAFADRFGTVATMAERLASLVDGISKRLTDLLDRLDRRPTGNA